MPVVLKNGSGPASESVQNRIAAGSFNTFLTIVPTKRKIRHLERELIDAQNGKAISVLHLHTLESLALILFPQLWPEKKLVSGATRELLFQEAILSIQETLRYFSPRKGVFPIQKGTFDKVVEVITTLKESGIFLDMLNGELELAAADERLKLHDVIRIYEAFENELDKLGATDLPGVISHFHLGCTQQRFNEAFQSLFPEVTLVSIAGFDEFTEPELGFIRKLNAVPGLAMTLIFDFLPGNEELFGHLQENYERFVEFGFSPANGSGMQFSIKAQQNADRHQDHVHRMISHIAQHLFFVEGQVDRYDSYPSITLACAKDRSREVEYVCRRVKQILLDNPGMDMSRICIAMPQPSPYTPLLREVFAKFGVPANITDRYLLIESPVVVAILGLLRIAVRGFQRDDLLRVIGSPYFTFQHEAVPVDSANLASVANTLRITAGYRTWIERLDNERSRLRKAIAANPDAGGLPHELQAVEKACEDVQYVHELLEDLQVELTPREFRARLLYLMNRTALVANMLEPFSGEPSGGIERDVRAYRKFLEILEEAMALLEYQDGAGSRHSPKHYVDYLSVAIAGERYNVREQFGRGVLVTSIQETRGLQLDVMFIMGLVDGEFPSVYQPELFYSLERQKKRAHRYAWEQRYLFYQGITNWSTHLYLTYPEQEGDRELVRSSFVDALLEIASVEELRAEDVLKASTDVLSEEELFFNHASKTGSPDVFASVGSSFQSKRSSIDRAISVEQSRALHHTHPAYEGILQELSADGMQKLQNFSRKTYSITQLESYGKCPFQFFARHVMRLAGPGGFDEELGPLEKGSVLHTILFAFYRSRKSRSLPSLQACSDDEFAAARKELLSLAVNTLAQLDIPDPFWEFEKELITGSEAGPGLLEEFLDYERQRTTTATPEFFEVAFGSRSKTECDPDLSLEEPLSFGEIKLRGRIDRVELDDSGVFNVIDYKTGMVLPSPEEMRQGMSLQIPLYLVSVEKLLERMKGKRFLPGAGLYYRLRPPVKLQSAVASKTHKGKVFDDNARAPRVVENDNELREVLDRAVSHSHAFVENIGRGYFPLTSPERVNKVCSVCEMKAMCRIQSFNHVNPAIGENG